MRPCGPYFAGVPARAERVEVGLLVRGSATFARLNTAGKARSAELHAKTVVAC